MTIRRTHASWAVKLWVIATVFVLPFLDLWQIPAWLLVGGAAALVWKLLPEEPEPPDERLPFHDQYADRQIPRRGQGE